MEKIVKVIGIVKWLAPLLGAVMYFFTRESFGVGIGALLGAAATVSFWSLMRKEQSRMIGQTIAEVIRDAIDQAADVESLIEIKRIRSGIIARVYLINARDKVAVVHREVTRKIENCALKNYLWIMQVTDVPGKGALPEMRKLLNEQLLEALLNKRKGDRDQSGK